MLEALVVVRIAFIVVGALLCILDFLSYCKQKLLDKLAFYLAVLGVVMIIVGAVPSLSSCLEITSLKSGIILIVFLVIALWIIYTMCVQISLLTLKNQELAIQVSLLNCESAKYERALNELSDESELVKN